ncbi:hypothetical protein HDV05_000743 [Chytridiales sp. JEL 0842]|nr:hypothetical protein HDV05_000743 [Chytridiales sp. JEL 0842]
MSHRNAPLIAPAAEPEFSSSKIRKAMVSTKGVSSSKNTKKSPLRAGKAAAAAAYSKRRIQDSEDGDEDDESDQVDQQSEESEHDESQDSQEEEEMEEDEGKKRNVRAEADKASRRRKLETEVAARSLPQRKRATPTDWWKVNKGEDDEHEVKESKPKSPQKTADRTRKPKTTTREPKAKEKEVKGKKTEAKMKKEADVEMKETSPEPEPVDDSPIHIPLYDSDSGEIKDSLVRFNPLSMAATAAAKPREVKSQSLRRFGANGGYGGCGILQLGAGAERPTKNSPVTTLVFTVDCGKVQVTINDETFDAQAPCVFIVERGCTYKIKNLADVTSVLHFTQCAEPLKTTEN